MHVAERLPAEGGHWYADVTDHALRRWGGR